MGAAVVTAEAVPYDFEVAGLDAAATLEVRFANDAYDRDSGIDRNLYVESVDTRVDGVSEDLDIASAIYERDQPTLADIPGQNELYGRANSPSISTHCWFER